MPAVSLSGVYNSQFTTDTGDLAANYRLYTFTPATTTKKVAYTETTGSTAHTYVSDGSGGEYIALNARGELPAPLFLQTGGYDLTLKTSAGVTVWTRRAYGTTEDAKAAFSASSGSSLVGFLQSGNATARTVQAKLRDRICVSDFGTVADGVADDTAAIAAAMSAATAGQTVYFDLPGTYLVATSVIDTAVVVPQGVNVEMCRGAWLRKSDGGAGSILAPLGSNVLQVNIDGGGYPLSGGVPGTWVIENDGIRAYFDASIGLGATDVVIRDSEIKNCRYGVYTYGAQRWKVYGSKIHRIKQTGVLMGFYQNYDCAYNLITENFFEDLGDYAVAFFQVGGESDGFGVYNTVANNSARNCNLRASGYAYGVETGTAAYQRGFLFIGNQYLDTDTTGTLGHGGIVMATCTNSAAVGNVLIGSLNANADQGINILGSVGCLVADNVIEQFRGNGIFSDGSTNATLRGNVLRDCGDANNSYCAIQFALARDTTGTLIQGNSLTWSDGYAHAGAGHIAIGGVVDTGKTVSRITIDGNRLHNPPQSGVGAFGLSGNTLDVLTISRNVMTGDALFAAKGFSLDYVSTVRIVDNVIRDAGAASTITNNSTTVISNNVGYLTEASGLTAAIASGGTVTHGLVAAPTKVYVTAAESGPTDVYVASVGAATFSINFGGGGNKTFYWRAEV